MLSSMPHSECPHSSSRYRKEATAALLLSRGANTTLTDADGMNALHLAVNNRLTEIVTQLLQTFLVDLNLQDNMMNTALHYAAINDDVNICKALLDHGASIDVTNTSEETALHLAAGENNKDIVEVLLNLGGYALLYIRTLIVYNPQWSRSNNYALSGDVQHANTMGVPRISLTGG